VTAGGQHPGRGGEALAAGPAAGGGVVLGGGPGGLGVLPAAAVAAVTAGRFGRDILT
jgi:hypothetical protein